MKGLSACFNSPCTRCLSAALGAALATAHGILEHRITKAALKMLALAASLYVGYYNPVRGIVLLLGAFIVGKGCSKILSRFSKTQPQESEQLTIKRSVLENIIQRLAIMEQRMTGALMDCMALRLNATKESEEVNDCTKFDFQPREDTSYRSTGVDRLDQRFYAFQFYYLSVEQARAAQWTGIEVIYQKTDGSWMSCSKKPTFFRVNGPVDFNAIDALQEMVDGGSCIVSSADQPFSKTRCFLNPP